MKYDSSCGMYEVPRTEFLVHRVKEIEAKIIAWYKKNHYESGDSYCVTITNNGKWRISYSNDYPMQHGEGKDLILTEEDFINAMKHTLK